MKQVATRVEPVPVYRDGDREWSEQFAVIVYDNGEVALPPESVRKWEIRRQHYLDLAERGELPEPSDKGSHEAAGG
jgi:hypothetical protein